ncbi:18291_t:CDS:2, partial [Racocetra persica]
LIFEDLFATTPLLVLSEPCPYLEFQDKPTQITVTFGKLIRAKDTRDQIGTLVHTFYLDAIYYLFEPFGIEQIYRTTYLILLMINKLKAAKFNQLLQKLPVKWALFSRKEL